MAVYFFDSSALVKRYVQETGSAWIIGLTDKQAQNPIYSAGISALTFLSADQELNAAAAQEGLVVDDPNQH